MMKEDLKYLRVILTKESETGESGNKIAYSSINEDLHSAIARMSKNRYL